MNVLDLFATITLDTTDFGNGIRGVSKEMLQAKKNIENVASSVKNAAKTFATIGASIGAAGTAVFAFANKVSQNGDNIDKMSQKLGMSAEAYQEWDHIMQHCGTSIESMQASMKTLASAAETGNDAFEKLGISQESIASMSQEELFGATIKALQNVESETERTYLAGKLLGRGATELGPLLNTSAEDIEAMRKNLHDMGAVMSDEAVKNSAAFQDSLTNLKASLSGASNSIGAELIPKFTVLMDRITEFVSNGGIDKIITGFQNLIPLITGAATAMVTYKTSSAIAGVITAVTKALDGQALSFKALFAAMNTNPFTLIATLIATVISAIVTLYMTNEDFRNKVNDVWNSVKNTVSSVVSLFKTFFTKTLPDAIMTSIKWLLDLPNTMREIGKNLIMGLWNGIADKVSWLKDQVSGVVNKIKSWFTGKDGFDEHSPSKWSYGVFSQLIQGGINGLESEADNLMKSAFSITSKLKESMSDFGDIGISTYTNKSGSNSLSGLVINVTVNGNADAKTGTDIGRAIANEMRYRGVLNYV